MEFDLQKDFLARLMREEQPVKIIVNNGYQMTGKILGYDRYVIVLYVDGARQLVYKSAISTIREAV